MHSKRPKNALMNCLNKNMKNAILTLLMRTVPESRKKGQQVVWTEDHLATLRIIRSSDSMIKTNIPQEYRSETVTSVRCTSRLSKEEINEAIGIIDILQFPKWVTCQSG